MYMIYEFSAMLLAPDTLVAKPHTENQPNNICSAVVLDHLSLSSLSLSLSVAGSVCRTVFFFIIAARISCCVRPRVYSRRESAVRHRLLSVCGVVRWFGWMKSSTRP